MTNLRFLNLDRNALSGTIPTEYGKLEKLQLLDLSSCQLSGPIPSEFGRLSNLYMLHLNDNQLSGSIPNQLSNIPGMNVLVMSGNLLSGSIPSGIFQMTELHHLLLHNNHLVGPVPESVTDSSQLRHIWLDHNQLSGTLSSQLGQLTSLTSLLLHNNQLSGSIPSEIGNFLSMDHLMLHDNRFEDQLPVLRSRYALTVHDNYLTGTIPRTFGLLSQSIDKTPFQKPLLSLAGNYLSCALPAFETSDFRSFSSAGNQFDLESSKNLRYDGNSPYLFVPESPEWVRLIFLTLIGSLSLIFVLFVCIGIRPPRNIRRMFIPRQVIHPSMDEPFIDSSVITSPRIAGPFLRLQVVILRNLGLLVTFSMFAILPVYVLGSTLYSCGDPMGHLTLAYFSNSSAIGSSWALPVLTCIYFSIVSHIVVDFQRRGDSTFSKFERPISFRDIDPPSIFSEFGRVAGWGVGVIVLSIPAAFYVLLHAPALDMSSNTVETVGNLINPFWFFFVDALLLPWLARWATSPRSNVLGRHHTFDLVVLLLSRLLAVIILPVIYIFIFDDGCHGIWRWFWDECGSRSQAFDVSADEYSNQTFRPLILSTNDICSRTYRPGYCPRRIIQLTSDMLLPMLSMEATILPAILGILLASPPAIRAWIGRILESYLSIGAFGLVHTITWLEIAIIFGFASPLVSLFALLAVTTNHLTFKALASRGMLTRNDASRTSSIPSWYGVVSLYILLALVLWFFFDDDEFLGKYLVAAFGSGLVIMTTGIVFREASNRRSKKSLPFPM